MGGGGVRLLFWTVKIDAGEPPHSTTKKQKIKNKFSKAEVHPIAIVKQCQPTCIEQA